MMERLRIAWIGAALAGLCLASLAPAHAQSSDGVLLPREHVQELVRSALRNPSDTAALRRLEAALPASPEPTWREVAADATGHAVVAAGATWTDITDRVAAIPPSQARGAGLGLSLVAALALLVLIRRQVVRGRRGPGERMVTAVRELALAGADADEVTEKTGVSRDAVEMLMRLGGRSRSDTPRPAGRRNPVPSTMEAPPRPPVVASSPSGDGRRGLQHLSGGVAAYTALEAARPAQPAPQRATIRFSLSPDLPRRETSAPTPHRGFGSEASPLGSMIGDLFSDPSQRPGAGA